jgi:transposase
LTFVRPYFILSFIAHIHKKIKKGRPYYYIREIARVDGKPKVISQVYLGSIERILEMAKGTAEKFKKISVQEFGALFIANLIEEQVGIAPLIDSVLPRVEQEPGPSVGEYFLYAVFNRMVDSCSKRAFPDWFRETAIQQIRPVDLEKLTSKNYWDKWDRVAPEDIEKISSLFFQRVCQLEKVDADCFLFDTTDHTDWSTDQIVQASLDRYMVEKTFRQSKDSDLVSLFPFRPWTDNKIRGHILTGVVALTYLRLLEIRLHRAGLSISASTAMENMRRLHSCLCWTVSKRSADRFIEEPTQIQAQILAAFGYKIAGGVLQNIVV